MARNTELEAASQVVASDPGVPRARRPSEASSATATSLQTDRAPWIRALVRDRVLLTLAARGR
jgi:hypothetical protein